MRSKLDVEAMVKKHIAKGEIVEKHQTIRSQCRLFVSKAKKNIVIAALLLKISQDKQSKDFHNLPNDFSADEWVIIMDYYSMFHAAKGALAKENIKIGEENAHEAAINAMYYYYVHTGKLETKLFFMLENAKQKVMELIESLETAKTLRNEVNYELEHKPRRDTAIELHNDAKIFVNKMQELVEGP